MVVILYVDIDGFWYLCGNANSCLAVTKLYMYSIVQLLTGKIGNCHVFAHQPK